MHGVPLIGWFCLQRLAGSSTNMATVPENLFDENQLKGKPFKDIMDQKSRRTLQSLQLSAKGKNLVGKGREQTGKVKKIKPSAKPVKVFSDSETKTSQKNLNRDKRSKSADFSILEERSTQTDALQEDVFTESDLAEADREALELMSGEEATESYWQILAEERRKALNDTLEENEELHKEIESLREENTTLTELANTASNLSRILQSVISDDDDDDGDGDDRNTDVENNGVVVQDDDTTETTQQRFINSDDSTGNSSLNTENIASKMFKTNDVITSSPIHALLNTISKSEYAGGIISPLFQDSSPKELNSVLDDSNTTEEAECEDAVILRDNHGSSKLKKNRDSDEWVNVELNHDTVTSVDLITSENLVVKNNEEESKK